jgi:hypothetical protein
MKNKLVRALLAVVAIAGFSSCRPANISQIENVATNETAFLVPLGDDAGKQVKLDSEKFLEDKKVSLSRIEIPQKWRSTGYFYTSGEYIPLAKLIKVDRAPVTVQWQASTDRNGTAIRVAGDKSIWIESKDSVGFSVGWNVSSYIKSEDAVKFLYMYAGRPLEDVMNTEVHGRVMEVSQQFASAQALDILREQKGEMSLAVQKDVTAFFAERGITVTNIGMFGGFIYEDPKIQASINGVFISQQLKNTSKAEFEAQDSINQKQVSAAKAKASAIEEEANGTAKAYVIEAQGKADAVALEVKALQTAQSNPLYIQIQQLNVSKEFNSKWDGRLPTQYIGSKDVTTIMGIPDMTVLTKK